MVRLYRYVGPVDIARRTVRSDRMKVEATRDVLKWIQETRQEKDGSGAFVATFIVDEAGTMWLADRHSEHVACAKGEAVQAAGEISFHVEHGEVHRVTATNQSTGYCPEPECWFAVHNALEAAGLPSSSGFEHSFVFRRCEACGTINIVKDGVFECPSCGTELSQSWNCDSAS